LQIYEETYAKIFVYLQGLFARFTHYDEENTMLFPWHHGFCFLSGKEAGKVGTRL
jgi:hypothetical protein